MSNAFDHRKSIATYLDSRADTHESKGSKDIALALRIESSNVKALLDVHPRADDIMSPVQAIIRQVGRAFHTRYDEIVAEGKQSVHVAKVRAAAMWVAKKRLKWSNPQLAVDFRRDQSTISHNVAKANSLRAVDLEFRRITDNLLIEDIRCEHCQAALVDASQLTGLTE